jgi:hypothetical protein
LEEKKRFEEELVKAATASRSPDEKLQEQVGGKSKLSAL